MDNSSHAVDGEVGLFRIVAGRGRILRETDRIPNAAVRATANARGCFADPLHCAHHVLPGIISPLYGHSLSFGSVVWDTGQVGAVKPLHRTTTETDVSTDETVITKRPWRVVVWDDPVTPMSVVVVIFKKIFGYSDNKCTQLMLTVHHEGRAIVWSGQRDRAQNYCVKLQVAGLQSTIEQDQ